MPVRAPVPEAVSVVAAVDAPTADSAPVPAEVSVAAAVDAPTKEAAPVPEAESVEPEDASLKTAMAAPNPCVDAVGIVNVGPRADVEVV